jgi:hypothetical protein
MPIATSCKVSSHPLEPYMHTWKHGHSPLPPLLTWQLCNPSAQGLKADTLKERYQKIGDTKRATPIEVKPDK